jgi:hypothetical protein
LCLAEVMPKAASTPNYRSPLQRTAQRIARNREVIGVHYPSDSAAGEKLAQMSFMILMEPHREERDHPGGEERVEMARPSVGSRARN